MKRRILLFYFLGFICTIQIGRAQQLNWSALEKKQKHIVHLAAGWDYGLVYGAGYSRQLETKMPLLLSAQISIPSGKKVADDLKIKMGGQIRFLKKGNFQTGASLNGIYRLYQNPLVRMQNIGAELNLTAGYYKPKWFIAAELGFDKSLSTHFKHSDSFKENIYGAVQDGWQSNTGGNFMYGLMAGYSFKRSDLTFKFGKVIAQDFKSTPLIPYYLQVGYFLKIGKAGGDK